jgi:hypothetical protein
MEATPTVPRADALTLLCLGLVEHQADLTTFHFALAGAIAEARSLGLDMDAFEVFAAPVLARPLELSQRALDLVADAKALLGVGHP